MDASTDNATPLGRQLAGERERQGLSRAEVAQRLHMSPSQVEALESGEYSRLPRGPFLRGFVRNYAKALGLEPETFVAQLSQDRPAESAPRIVVPSQNIRFDPLGERLANPYVKAAGLATVVIALGFAAMYWWFFIRPTPPAAHKAAEPPRAAVPASSRSATPSVAPSTGSTPSGQPTTPATTLVPPASVPPQEVKPEPAPPEAEERKAEPAKADVRPAAPAKGEAVLRFRFKGESWVEVRDARDNVVYQRLNAADSEDTVSARLPLKVIVGNAPEVSLRFNDRDFPLEPYTKVAVARFTLE